MTAFDQCPFVTVRHWFALGVSGRKRSVRDLIVLGVVVAVTWQIVISRAASPIKTQYLERVVHNDRPDWPLQLLSGLCARQGPHQIPPAIVILGIIVTPNLARSRRDLGHHDARRGQGIKATKA